MDPGRRSSGDEAARQHSDGEADPAGAEIRAARAAALGGGAS